MKRLTIDFYYKNLKKFKEMTISNQALFDEDWEILKKLKMENNYFVLIKCKHCGALRIGKWHSTLYSKKLRICTECNSTSAFNKRVGKTYGTIKVISLDHIDRVYKNGHLCLRVYYLTECTKCGRQSIRLYNKNQWEISDKCRYCDKNIISNNSAYNYWWRVYHQGADSRNIMWNLNPKEFLSIIQQNCYYCGEPPQARFARQGRAGNKTLFKTPVNGIDRIDSSKGYTIDNCVPCCSKCNYMKQSFSQKDFLSHVEKIYLYQNKEGSETIETTSKDGTE